MGNSDSVPLKPEEVQTLRQTFTAEKLEEMLDHASSLYGEETELGDPDLKMLEDIDALKVKHEEEIFKLKTKMKNMDELHRETERCLHEVKWELEEKTEQNRQYEVELEKINGEIDHLKKSKFEVGVGGKNVEEALDDQKRLLEEKNKKVVETKVKDILRLKKEKSELVTKCDNLEKQLQHNKKENEDIVKKMKDDCEWKQFEHELKFGLLQRKYDDLNKTHDKVQASLDLAVIRSEAYATNNELLRKKVDDLKSENSSLQGKGRSESPFRFRDIQIGK